MTGNEIRAAFLDYFAEKGHQKVKSSGLLPQNDPTLLFANAGMNQFKDCFLGIEKRDYTRAATAQKCVRAGGKHNDLENVGYTARHHTFFEMLGNFSFGDYFKRDAIAFAWELLTVRFGLPKDRLWVTVFREDDEAEKLWQEVAGVSKDRIVRLGEKDNFWAMGDEGPCGPCSEILIDQGPEVGCNTPDCKVGCDCDRYLELWNLVFMQYNRSADGTLTPLPNPSIDTGMGLERVASVLQGKKSNFDTDLLSPYIEHLAALAGVKYNESAATDGHLRVIADHIRSITFLIADGILPSNEGRGYVLRRILRRAVRHANMLGFKEPVLARLVPTVGKVMGAMYPEVVENAELATKVVTNEEERFLATLDTGLRILFDSVETMKKQGATTLSGDLAFKLYDTYGFPVDLTGDVLREHGMDLDNAGFERAMEAQREMARASWKGEGEALGELHKRLAQDVKVEFTGYAGTSGEGSIVRIVAGGAEVASLAEGLQGELIADCTPFYGESGGQAGDTGVIGNASFDFNVTATVKVNDLIIHKGVVTRGTVATGMKANFTVESRLRDNTASHHTATHLLQAALQQVLGGHVKQAGSLVNPERLRFDFTHFSALTDEQRLEVEGIVNRWVRENHPVATAVMSHDDAVKTGAMAIFGEKYGETVRVVAVGDGVSKEFCGGTHQTATGRIGLFKIVGEESVAAGVRRIEAVAGEAALAYVQAVEAQVGRIAATLRSSVAGIEQALERRAGREKELEKEIESLRQKLSNLMSQQSGEKKDLPGGGAAFASRVDASSVDQLRTIMDSVKQREPDAVIFLAADVDGKAALIVTVPDSLTARYDAGAILKAVVGPLNGRGGGKKNMAQGGAPEAGSIDAAIKGFFASTGA